jgi:Rod binding domain-containing protein
MDIHPLQSRHIDLSNLPLDRVAASTQIDQKEKISQVSRAFEAVLLRQILQESQKPAFKSKLESNTATDGIYRDMVVNQLAENISKSGTFGLAKSLSGELQRQTGVSKSASPTHAPGGIKLTGPRAVAARSAQSHVSVSGALDLPGVAGAAASRDGSRSDSEPDRALSQF